MARIERRYPKGVSADILTELTNALGVGPDAFAISPGKDETIIWGDEGLDWGLIDQVVAAHDPLIYKQAQDRRQQNMTRDRLIILNFAKSTTAPSPAQVLAFQKAVARDHLRVLGALRDEDDT